MDYSEASKIRNKSFGSLLAEQEGGVLSSLSKTISLKSKAKVEGLKEKFDPLNIAKFVTGGSNLAPALLGKLTGRKQSTIKYFSGAKDKNKGTASKLNSYGMGSSEALSILQEIESLLHKTREEDKLIREKQQNFSEEKELERQKRHKELVKALKALVASAGGTTSTATKVDGFSGSNFQMPDLMKLVEDALLKLIPNFKDLLKLLESTAGLFGVFNLLRKFVSAGTGLAWLGSLLGGPVAFAGLVSAAIIGGAALKGKQEVERYTKLGGEEAGNLAAERQTDEYLGAGDPGALGSAIMNAGEETKGEKINKLVTQKQNLIQELVAENGFNKVGVTPQGEYIFKNKEGKSPPPEYMREVNAQADRAMKQGIVAGPTREFTSGDTGIIPINKEKLTPKDTTPTPTLPRQEAGPQLMDQISKATSKLNAVQSESLDLNRPKPNKSNDTTVINNSVNSDVNKEIRQVTIPLVRNDEATLQNLMVYSTRIV